MILHDMVDYVTTGGLGMTGGTNLFAGEMQASPDTAVCIYQGPGRAPVHTMGDVAGQAVMEYPRIQVVSRAVDYLVAHANAQKAFLLFDGMPKRTLNGVQYHWSVPLQSPFQMGKDEQKRHLITFNVELMKNLSTTS